VVATTFENITVSVMFSKKAGQEESSKALEPLDFDQISPSFHPAKSKISRFSAAGMRVGIEATWRAHGKPGATFRCVVLGA
jgi:hypothetical protein